MTQYKWVALMDDHGRELTYMPNYARQRIPWPAPEDWCAVFFGKLGADSGVTLHTLWVCDSETSRMRDGKPFAIGPKVITPLENVNIHFRSPASA